MDGILDWLRDAPLWQTIPAALAENFVLHGIAVVLGELALRRFPHRRVSEPAPPLSRGEVVTAVVTLLTNSLTTIAGLYLWRAGFIRFSDDVSWWVLLDLALLVLVMDGAMYALHRVAHLPWVYPWLHHAHHVYVDPRPLTLFILNPIENLAFGALLLAVFVAYPFSWTATIVFLGVNVASGILGHLGVEPLPDWWARAPVLRYFTGGSFHARHHQDETTNFGFYTLIWDGLFRTLRGDYWERFGKMPAGPGCADPLGPAAAPASGPGQGR